MQRYATMILAKTANEMSLVNIIMLWPVEKTGCSGPEISEEIDFRTQPPLRLGKLKLGLSRSPKFPI